MWFYYLYFIIIAANIISLLDSYSYIFYCLFKFHSELHLIYENAYTKQDYYYYYYFTSWERDRVYKKHHITAEIFKISMPAYSLSVLYTRLVRSWKAYMKIQA